MNDKKNKQFWDNLNLDYETANFNASKHHPVSSKDIRTWFIGKELLSKPRALTDYDQTPQDSN